MEGELYQQCISQNLIFKFLRGGHDFHPGRMLFHHRLPEQSLKKGWMHLNKS